MLKIWTALTKRTHKGLGTEYPYLWNRKELEAEISTRVFSHEYTKNGMTHSGDNHAGLLKNN